MAIYIVTGKLGGGKTLAAVSKIDSALGQGRRVATNLDLNIALLPSCSRRSRNTRVTRVPDRPSVDDIKALGFGIEGVNDLSQARQSYDESRFGILVLDECGTWLNSRDWQAEGRRELINFLLHIRKHLWDVYLIIQDISLLDKQARKALAEHVVYCRRFDRIGIPGIGFVVGLMTGTRWKMPKLHMAVVKYGDQPQSMTVDRWWYRGNDLYDAYDTTQVFLDDYEHGVYSVLPPWYLYFKSFVDWDWRKRLQLTKIYLRQYSKTLLLAAGVFAGTALASAMQPEPPPAAAPVVTENAQGMLDLADSLSATDEQLPLLHRLRIASLRRDIGRTHIRFSDGVVDYTSRSLQALGLTVRKVGECEYRIDSSTDHAFLSCFD